MLASVPLLGHLPASLLIDRGGDAAVAAALAEGTERAAFAPARPPSDIEDAWTVEPELGSTRAPAPELADGAVTGAVHWVPDAAGADHLVVVLADGRAAHVARRGRRRSSPRRSTTSPARSPTCGSTAPRRRCSTRRRRTARRRGTSRRR